MDKKRKDFATRHGAANGENELLFWRGARTMCLRVRNLKRWFLWPTPRVQTNLVDFFSLSLPFSTGTKGHGDVFFHPPSFKPGLLLFILAMGKGWGGEMPFDGNMVSRRKSLAMGTNLKYSLFRRALTTLMRHSSLLIERRFACLHLLIRILIKRWL